MASNALARTMNILAVVRADGVNLTVAGGRGTADLRSFHTSTRDSNARRAGRRKEGFAFF